MYVFHIQNYRYMYSGGECVCYDILWIQFTPRSLLLREERGFCMFIIYSAILWDELFPYTITMHSSVS